RTWKLDHELVDLHAEMEQQQQQGEDQAEIKRRQHPPALEDDALDQELDLAHGELRDAASILERHGLRQGGAAPGRFRSRAPGACHAAVADLSPSLHCAPTATPVPIGQLTPVPPSPQYPIGFLARYCWW